MDLFLYLHYYIRFTTATISLAISRKLALPSFSPLVSSCAPQSRYRLGEAILRLIAACPLLSADCHSSIADSLGTDNRGDKNESPVASFIVSRCHDHVPSVRLAFLVCTDTFPTSDADEEAVGISRLSSATRVTCGKR